MLTEEVLSVPPPTFHVDGAAQHDGVVGRDVVDVAALEAIDLEVGLADRLRDCFCNLRGRTSLGCVGDQDLHDFPRCWMKTSDPGKTSDS